MNKNNLVYTYDHKQDKMTILGCAPCKFCQLKVIGQDGNEKMIMVCSCGKKCTSLNKFKEMQ
jgi:hypothetical protein